jgi:hypothetical protein
MPDGSSRNLASLRTGEGGVVQAAAQLALERKLLAVDDGELGLE